MKANFFFDGKINGTISFQQINRSRPIEVEIELSGLQKSHLHGLHIHENADLTNHCMNTIENNMENMRETLFIT